MAINKKINCNRPGCKAKLEPKSENSKGSFYVCEKCGLAFFVPRIRKN